MNTINSLEEMAEGNTIIHHLHPMVKLITTILYLVLVISFDPYNITGLMVFAFYPVILMALSEIPYKPLLKRMLVALPFSFFAGLSNIIFDQKLAMMIGTIPVSYGVISFTTIIVKTVFTVMAVLILIATTSLPQISYQLLAIKVPKIIVEQIMLTYRYISVLLEQVSNMYTAYILRAPDAKGIKMKDMGIFVGQLLLKSFDRAENIYYAMKCRGYDGNYLYAKPNKINQIDWTYLLVVGVVLLLMRFFNLSQIIGSFL
ncbi:cobalt ECF transporter T component CbiQ [Acetobacterium woodii]|nr:cobalt ECF transporter T component CbiQ [Acetobacterium woodii]